MKENHNYGYIIRCFFGQVNRFVSTCPVLLIEDGELPRRRGARLPLCEQASQHLARLNDALGNVRRAEDCQAQEKDQLADPQRGFQAPPPSAQMLPLIGLPRPGYGRQAKFHGSLLLSIFAKENSHVVFAVLVIL
jgi:hypothetical protein